MSVKKKLGLGVASAALGISLVGGGTWAAFNDVETLDAIYKAGTLDLTVDDVTTTGINLSNLKPGDVFQKEFELDAIGSLAIKDVLLQVKHRDFVDYLGGDDPDTFGSNSAEDFLSQFTITVASIGTEGGNGYEKEIVKDVNLLDFISMTHGNGKPSSGSILHEYYDEESGRMNVVTKSGPDGAYHGLPVDPDDQDKVLFTIRFDNHDEKDANGLQVQNKFQGDSIALDFIFEARQWEGLNVGEDHVDDNGYIKKNEQSHSEGDGGSSGNGNGGDPGNGNDDDPGNGDGGDPGNGNDDDPGNGDGGNPGDGDGEDDKDPEEITVTGVKVVKEEWSSTGHLWWKEYTLKAQIEFTFSNGNKIKSSTITRNNADPNGETITFTQNYKGKEYTHTETFKK